MTMSTTIIGCVILLLLLQFKHWIVDFVLQKEPIDSSKNLFLNYNAFEHSAKHGLGTFIAATLVFPEVGLFTLSLGMLDAILHHIIDWGKTKIENATNLDQCGNFLIGCDQLMHQLSYIGYIVIILWAAKS